ncbi:MAG: efflux RND transporter periplasmic adaptor subunit [Weeksellaceae bacterium]|jgi:RND family efflux transporter MFP subunit|nr:efflux RND transporter periplasmic adaptor subunit [Weeksellaceae bacterium]
MKTIKSIAIAILVIGLIVLAGFKLVSNKKKSEEETRTVAKSNDSISVNVSKVEFRNINTTYMVNGTFEPAQEIDFPSETSGKVLSVMVDEGSFVGVGQTLAIIRADQQSIDLTAAEAAYQNALTDNERYENAFKTGGVTQQQVDMSRLQLKNAKAQLDQAKIRVGDTRVKATISGIVNQRMVEPGSYVSPGTVMFEIVDVSSLKLRVEVDENHVVNYKVGDIIKVRASVYPDKEFAGKITFIAPKAGPSLNFPMDITVTNNTANNLKAGMYGTAVFSSEEDETQNQQILTLSRNAFVGGLSAGEVFLIKDGKAQLTKIVSGRNFGDWVEVLEGLKEGDTVVTAGQINLSEGAVVKIIDRN